MSADCILWTGRIGDHGYGLVHVDGVRWLVHRLSYTEAKGAIPEGLHIDHLCMVKACYNPEHLEAVTPAENARRAHDALISPYCPSGHLYDEENTLYYKGRRRCRECANVRRRNGRGRPRIKGCCPLGHPKAPDNMTAHGRCLTCKRERGRLKAAERRQEQRSTR